MNKIDINSIKIGKIIPASLSGLLLSLILGYIYAAFTIYMPIVYFNLIAVVVTGIIISYTVRFLAYVFKIRALINKLIISIILSFFTYYFQWVAYALLLLTGSFPDFVSYLSHLDLFTQDIFYQLISDLYVQGNWTMFGIPFKDFALGLVWLFEAGLLFIVPLKFLFQTTTPPFSERYNQWYPKYKLSKKFKSKLSKSQLLKKLDEDALQALDEMGYGSDMNHLRIYLYYLEIESGQYISIESVQSINEGKTKQQMLADRHKIDKNTARQILKKYKHKKDFFNF